MNKITISSESQGQLFNNSKNPNAVLLASLRINWNWIFLPYKNAIYKKTEGRITQLEVFCEASGIWGSNLNNSCCLLVKSYSPSYMFTLNLIRSEMITMINEFFKLKLLTDIRIVAE